MANVDPAWADAVLTAAQVEGLSAWSATTWEGGLRLVITTRWGEVGLDLEARHDGPSYASTPSVSAYLRHDGSVDPAVERVARRVLDVIASSDTGGMTILKGERVPEDRVEGPVLGDPKQAREDALLGWLGRAEALPERLQEAARLALWAADTEEPYPFVAALGVVAGDTYTEPRGWLLSRWPEGPTRPEVMERWGEQGAEALMAIIEELVALGVIVVSDEGLEVYAGLGADPAIWSVWLWSPAVRAAAAELVAGPPDARAVLDRRVHDPAPRDHPPR